LDKRGVTRFETLPVKIDMEGLPTIDQEAVSPCWSRGETVTQNCAKGP
jgi:hypothetical protein